MATAIGKIDTLKTYISKYTPMPANRFIIRLNYPTADPIDMSCTNVNLPGFTLSTNPHTGIPGPDIKYPYQTAYEDAIVSFMSTEGEGGVIRERSFFENWLNKINPRIDSTYGHAKFSYRDSYTVDIAIMVLNSTNHPVHHTLLKNAYPIGIQAVELNHANEAIMSTSVTLSYSHFT